MGGFTVWIGHPVVTINLILRHLISLQPSTGTADLHACFYPPPKKSSSSVAGEDSEAGVVGAVAPPAAEAAAPVKPKKHILCVNT